MSVISLQCLQSRATLSKSIRSSGSPFAGLSQEWVSLIYMISTFLSGSSDSLTLYSTDFKYYYVHGVICKDESTSAMEESRVSEIIRPVKS